MHPPAPGAGSRPAVAAVVAFALALGAGCGAPPEAPSAGLVLTEAERSELLDAQNAVRAGATPAPDPALPPFTWSSALEGAAQAWAGACAWGHTPDLDVKGMGQNLAGGWPPEAYPSPELVALWADEAAWYDLAAGDCSAPPGKSCGHYTQLVWRETTEVGCGVATCAPSGPFTQTWKYLVCNYAPPGNWVGERPY